MEQFGIFQKIKSKPEQTAARQTDKVKNQGYFMESYVSLFKRLKRFRTIMIIKNVLLDG